LRRLAARLVPAAIALLAAPVAFGSEVTPSGEVFPLPLDAYTGEAGMTLWQLLVHRVEQ
jgi:hypothetical protein